MENDGATGDAQVANAHPRNEATAPKAAEVGPNSTPAQEQQTPKPRPPRRKKGPNYAQVHSKPLPLDVHPLPAFHPSSPISLLRLCYVYLSNILVPPTSHPSRSYIGHFSPDTRSIHVTDPAHIRALWEMGFFGKASLSRSEPTWLDRERARLKAEADGVRGVRAAEVVTNARREERRMFKLERARAEREKIERQQAVEQGQVNVVDGSELGSDATQELEADSDFSQTSPGVGELDNEAEGLIKKGVPMDVQLTEEGVVDPSVQVPSLRPDELVVSLPNEPLPTNGVAATIPNSGQVNRDDDNADEKERPDPNIQNQEHLQLTLEEAFFLSCALGVLQIKFPNNQQSPPSPLDLLTLFAKHASFPPDQPKKPRPLIPVPTLAVNSQPLHARAVSHAIAAAPLVKDPTESCLRIPITAAPLTPHSPQLSTSQQLPAPDNQFLLNYVVYHHFRSLGWVIRPGLKFGADYMLYNRGPVFSHAEFAVIIMPSYTDPYWETTFGKAQRRVKGEKDWWWLHCVNRVQSQVKKTLVLCYVDVPAPMNGDVDVDVAGLLRKYRVREIVIRRWAVNRSRD
ncbi:hypothetical protein B0A55_11216 [Friedmanniomyces simplex]|uniref:tRNA-intron lyase n=1 Tax=Friedmanniomyces simplex TaxID=329884 RepID=A0A4U0WFM0_9PEZI|nr:hypothetical protein B0A55_11216 [Friedmanniomyces simplex]